MLVKNTNIGENLLNCSMKKKLSLTNTLLTILVIAFAFFFPQLGIIPVPFSYTVPVIFIIWLMLKRTNENFASIGFSFKRFEFKAVWVGAIAAIVLFAFLNYALFPLINKLFVLPKADLESFKSVRHNLLSYIFILAMGFIVGGVYEEIVFHGFIFTRLEKMMPGKYAMVISFLLTNIIFGLYHVQLGTAGMLNAFFAGCAYLALMVKFNRNMWYAVFFHTFFDAIGLTLIYLGKW
jgi:membrane protease YdiL (CAAX protease family)